VRTTHSKDGGDRSRVISQALELSSVACRLLRAWHSGAIGAQDSMEHLWDSLVEIRSSERAIERELDCAEAKPGSSTEGGHRP